MIISISTGDNGAALNIVHTQKCASPPGAIVGLDIGSLAHNGLITKHTHN